MALWVLAAPGWMLNRRSWVLFGLMGAIWGVPYLFIKVAVDYVAPPVVVFGRTSLAAVPLLLLAARVGAIRPALARWRPLVAFAALEMAIPWLLLTDAERHLPSGLTGLLIACVPIAGAVVAYALGDHGAQEKGPDDGGDADNEKGRPHCTQHHLVDRVLAVLPLKELDQEHARDRHRDAPYRQPEHDRPMNGPVLQVPPCARGLGDGAVEDVRPHGRHRLDPEQEDQERRHQGAAAHAGHADQEADPEPEDDDYRIHEMSQLPHRGPSQAFMLFQSAW